MKYSIQRRRVTLKLARRSHKREEKRMAINQYYVRPNKIMVERLLNLGALFGCQVTFKKKTLKGKVEDCQYEGLPSHIVLNKDLGMLQFWYIHQPQVVAFGFNNCYRLQCITGKKIRIMRNPDPSSLIRPIFSL